MSFSNWIKKKYDNLKWILPNNKFEKLKLVSEYSGFDTPIEYIASLIKMELVHYDRNLQFEDWLDKRRER